MEEHAIFTCSFPSPWPLTLDEEATLDRVLQAYGNSHCERAAGRRGTTFEEAFTYERRRHHWMLLEDRSADHAPSAPDSDSMFPPQERITRLTNRADTSGSFSGGDTYDNAMERTPISNRLGAPKRVDTPAGTTSLYTPRCKKKHQLTDEQKEGDDQGIQLPDLSNKTDVKNLNSERTVWMSVKVVSMPAFNQPVKMKEFMKYKAELWETSSVAQNIRFNS